jgi:hypothetical protein
MKEINGIFHPKDKKPLRLVILLLSTVCVIGASAIAYGNLHYERALDVSNTGSGLTTSASISLSPIAIVLLLVPPFAFGLGLFWLLLKSHRQVRNILGEEPAPAPSPISVTSGEAGMSLTLNLPFLKGDEWEESPKKDEGRE